MIKKFVNKLFYSFRKIKKITYCIITIIFSFEYNEHTKYYILNNIMFQLIVLLFIYFHK